MFFLLQVLPVFGCLLSDDGSFEAFVVLLSREYVLSTDDIGNSVDFLVAIRNDFVGWGSCLVYDSFCRKGFVTCPESNTSAVTLVFIFLHPVV